MSGQITRKVFEQNVRKYEYVQKQNCNEMIS